MPNTALPRRRTGAPLSAGRLAHSEALRFTNLRHVTGTILTPIMPASRRHFDPGPQQFIRSSFRMSTGQLPWFSAVFSRIAELRSAPAR